MDALWGLLPNILAAGVAAGTPVLLAALGEIITERSGVLNIGLEGIMIMGCVSAVMVTLDLHSPLAGLAAAMAVGGIMGLLHAAFTITLKGNQIVSGLALVLLGSGLSTMLGKGVLGQPVFDLFYPEALPWLADLPYVGGIFFKHDPLTYGGILLAPLVWFFLQHTRPGLLVRAAGESPETADSLGAPVALVRYGAVIAGGALAGAGGAFLPLVQTPSWVEGMTSGSGWIALAVVIFARWDPGKALLGAWLYGAVQALGFRLQAVGVPIPSQFLNMLPYLAPIAVLVITASRSRGQAIAPRALGLPYERESR
ncbi:ABC transporter permease [Desulfocarbo indianensis]|nr:ABC transporter permease [Desulfocarbo indianensis]